MDIGTAKPSQADRRKIPHHLIDIVESYQEFSVARYQKSARRAIADIHALGKLPLLVGGSGLYIRAVIDTLQFPTGAVNCELRTALQRRLEKEGSDALYQELLDIDAEAAKRIHPGNERRLIRALEVIKTTGRPFSDFQKQWAARKSIYDLRMIALNLPRAELYAKIDARVDAMIDEGLIKEVQGLIDQGFGETVTSKQALGYRQVLDYLEGRTSLEECTRLVKRSTRNFAKRQLTWLRRDPRVVWMETTDLSAQDVAVKIMDHLAGTRFWE